MVAVENPIDGPNTRQERRWKALYEARYDIFMVPEVESVGAVKNFTALGVAASGISTLNAINRYDTRCRDTKKIL